MTDAAEYVIMGKRAQGPWTELHFRGGKQEAIDVARRLLDTFSWPAVVVQGRGTPEHPTPPSEVCVYRGVAAGYSARAFFPANVTLGDDVEVRIASARRRARGRR
jgi:hypothetical protein